MSTPAQSPEQVAWTKRRLLCWNPGDKPYEFWGTCEVLPGELVQYLVDQGERITYTTFARHANLEPLRREDHPAMYRLSAPDNWAVGFWRSRLPSGKRVYYFDWSSFEFVFVSEPVDLEHETSLLRRGNPLPALPIVKRGVAPTLVVGQFGTSALFTYRGWSIEVKRSHQHGWWNVDVAPPRGSGRATTTMLATSFDGGLCAAKIHVDLSNVIDTIQPSSDSFHLVFFWQLLYQIAQRQMYDYGKTDRKSAARRLETELPQLRQDRPMAAAWWDNLDLGSRIGIIDDRLQAAYCLYGTDWRNWPLS